MLWYELCLYYSILLPRNNGFWNFCLLVTVHSSYAPFKGKCEGTLEGCCGISFDHTTQSFSLELERLWYFSPFGQSNDEGS
jgi:hypothetical protein